MQVGQRSENEMNVVVDDERALLGCTVQLAARFVIAFAVRYFH